MEKHIHWELYNNGIMYITAMLQLYNCRVEHYTVSNLKCGNITQRQCSIHQLLHNIQSVSPTLWPSAAVQGIPPQTEPLLHLMLPVCW